MNFSDRAKTYNSESPWILNPEYIDPLIPAPYGSKMLLDVCSGTGVIAIAAKEKGWNALATDINMDMLSLAEDKIDVKYADINEMPFFDGQFEIVTCRQGLQYTDIRKSVMECLRVASHEVRLLHAYIYESDIPAWREIIRLMGRTPRQFFSNEMLSTQIKEISPDYSFKEYLLSSSREVLDFGSYQNRDLLIRFVTSDCNFMTNHNAIVDEYKMTYDLKWVLHIITKENLN